jgi:tetratricopeptide (TPR) repeat protein
MVKDHARIIGIVMLLVALGLAGGATRGAGAGPEVDAPIRCALLHGRPALDACDEALRSERSVAIRAEAAYNKGVELARLERWDEARLAHEQALRLAPDDVDARYDLGVALAALDRPEDALHAFRQVLRRAPTDADAHYNVGRTLNSLRRHAEAAQAYREAVRIRPGYADAWGNLGLSAILIGEYGEARDAFERAGALVPGYFESRPVQRQAWELVSRLARRPDSR